MIDGFESQADITVSGADATAIQADSGNSHSVFVYIPLVPAGATGSLQLTFTPMGRNYTYYLLAPLTLASSDPLYTPTTPDPSISVTLGPVTETASGFSGALHLSTSTSSGDIGYQFRIASTPRPAGGAPDPTVTETTLPGGLQRMTIRAVIGPPGQEPPTSFAAPGAGLIPLYCALGCVGPPGAQRAVGARAPAAHPAASGWETALAYFTYAKNVIDNYEQYQSINAAMQAVNQQAADELTETDCLLEADLISPGQAASLKLKADGAVTMTAFEQAQDELNLNANDAQALKLMEQVMSDAWVRELAGGGASQGPGDLDGYGLGKQPQDFTFSQMTPEERLAWALQLCPPPTHPKPKPSKPSALQRLLKQLRQKAKQLEQHAQHILLSQPPPYRIDIRNSVDPNSKSGPAGFGPRHFIRAGATLPYTITFQNEPTAGAPARDVRISDQLNPARVDLSRFSLGAVSFGTTVLTPPAGLSSWQDTIDLRPAKNLVVRVTAGLNRQTGLVSWDLQTLDPFSGQPPSDPLDGFLPPDTSPPAGEGAVTFNVRARPGLGSGQTIANNATIVFDQNAPISTPTWTNTIDRSPPTSRIVRVKSGGQLTVRVRHGKRVQRERVPSLVVAWTGSDCAPARATTGRHRERRHGKQRRCVPGSGVVSYDLYLSLGSSRFRLAVPGIAAHKVRIACAAGLTYRFYTIAHDGVGNVQRGHSPPSRPARCQ